MAEKKKGRPTKAELEKRRQAEGRKRKKEQQLKKKKAKIAAASVVLFAIGLFLFALTIITGEKAWSFLHNAMFGVFGPTAYAVGPLFVYLAVITALEKEQRALNILFVILLLAAVSGAVLIFSDIPVDGATFGEKIKSLYESGASHLVGGVLSMLFGWSLLELFGKVGAAITVCILGVVFLMLLTGKTIVGIAVAISDAAKIAKAKREEKQALKEKEEEKSAKEIVQEDKKRGEPEVLGIDIPLPGEKRNGRLKKVESGILPINPSGRVDIPLDDPLPVTKVRTKPGPNIDIPMPSKPLAPVEPEATPEDGVREYFEKLDRDAAVDAALDEVISRANEANRAVQSTEPATAVATPEFGDYRYPPITLLKHMNDTGSSDIKAELRANADKLVRTLEDFGVKTRVVDISCGPTVTRYELQPNQGVRVSKINNLADDIALNLATAGVRIEAPIPNKSAVGIEVPNRVKSMVSLRSIIQSKEFRDSKDPLTVALGKDIDGQVRVANIADMPHMLVAGATNSGKSVCLNSIIISVFYKSSPADVRLILIDPKSVELIGYNGIPHLLVPVVTDPKKASGALAFAVGEMMKRYKLFAETGVKNLESYNKHVELSSKIADENAEQPVKLPRILIVIDELSDLMMAAPNEVEDSICRLAQLARAAGIHLIVATQRPSVDVVTGLIKANIPSRVAFAVSSQIDSRTIIGMPGAEKLLGRGDMLFMPMNMNKPVRLQGCYVSEEETAAVVDSLKKNFTAQYNESVIAEIDRNAALSGGKKGAASAVSADTDGDVLLEQAIDIVVENGQASTSMLQRKLKLGYSRAARIVDIMEDMGIVGPPDGSKPREIRITREQWLERKQNRNT